MTKYDLCEARKCTGTVIAVFKHGDAQDQVHFIPSLCGGYFEAIELAKTWINENGERLIIQGAPLDE